MPSITAEFSPRDRVYVDGCENLVGVVTAVQWRHRDVINYEVSWIDSGLSHSPIIEGWRLTSAGQ